jgi:hypothetical protein
MVRVIFLLGQHVFVKQGGTYFISQELSLDFLSLFFIFGHELLWQINYNIEKRKKWK